MTIPMSARQNNVIEIGYKATTPMKPAQRDDLQTEKFANVKIRRI